MTQLLKDQERGKLYLRSSVLLCLIDKCYWVPQEADTETKISMKKAYQDVLVGLIPLGERNEVGWDKGRKQMG